MKIGNSHSLLKMIGEITSVNKKLYLNLFNMENFHDLEIEARYLNSDIESLKDYSILFKEAYENNQELTIEIKLVEIAKICPRKYIRTKYYNRLVEFLKMKNITLIIKSQKSRR